VHLVTSFRSHRHGKETSQTILRNQAWEKGRGKSITLGAACWDTWTRAIDPRDEGVDAIGWRYRWKWGRVENCHRKVQSFLWQRIWRSQLKKVNQPCWEQDNDSNHIRPEEGGNHAWMVLTGLEVQVKFQDLHDYRNKEDNKRGYWSCYLWRSEFKGTRSRVKHQ